MAAAFPDTFRAYEFAEHGDPFQTVRINANTQQTPLGPTEVRIKVMSTSLNIIDFIIPATPGFLERFVDKRPSPAHPLRLGFDASGVIVEVGRGVSEDKFLVGDAVIAGADFDCLGTFAEYVNLDAKLVVRKPERMGFNEAAGLALVGITSYQAVVEHGQIRAGDRVLVLGGSSATGLVGIQIAKALGASHVTATCSARNAELVQSVGADAVIDYTECDWQAVVTSHSVDLLYDCGMEPDAWNAGAQRVLRQGSGRFVTIGIPKETPVESEFGATRVALIAKTDATSLHELAKLAANGKLTVPIDAVHPFEQLVDAFKTVVSKRARGKVVVEVARPE